MNLSRRTLDRIGDQYGHPFYLLDTKQFTENFRRLVTSFRSWYPESRIAYSYKTNYTPRLCRLVDALGGFAEVVSDMECQVALKSGVAPSQIFLNGPCKSPSGIEALLIQGGFVNADSMDELLLIGAIAVRNPDYRFKIGLRCNFDVNDGVVSRFGFDVENGDLDAAKAFIRNVPNLQLTGLHCHFANRSLETWRNGASGMLELLGAHYDNGGDHLSFVSLGGGLFGPMPDALRAQFSVEIPDFEHYAEAAARPFALFFDGFEHIHRPLLLIEPGTALVANAMTFAAKICSIKTIRGRTIATLGGSIYNINPSPNRKNLPISVYRSEIAIDSHRYFENVDFAGYTCIETDYLYRGFSGAIAVDDIVVFEDVGAYSVVMKPPFIQPNVAVVEYDEESGVVELVKRQETFDDVFRTFSF